MLFGRSICALSMLLLKPANVRSFHGVNSVLGSFRKTFEIQNQLFIGNNMNVLRRNKMTMRKKKDDSFDDAWNGHGFSRGVKKPIYLPKSENQQKYVDALNQDDVSLIFSVGPAGTGKTLFACMYAIQELKKK